MSSVRQTMCIVSLLASACVAFVGACSSDNKTHPSHAAYDGGAAAPLQCVPNLDGKVEAKELAAILNVPVKYLVSPANKERAIDVVGAVDSAGHLSWNYGIDLADDQVATIAASALTGKWYAASFPNGQFATPFDAAGTLEAVYSQDDHGLYLQGLASKDPAPPEGKTLLAYTTPVTIFAFPLVVGATWTSTGKVSNGFTRGLPFVGQQTYESKDDATGELVLPDVTFTQVHRVRTKVTTVPAAGATETELQVSWVFECFGEVARAKSKPNETNENFTTAAEVRRFGL